MSAPPVFQPPNAADVESRAFINGAYTAVHGPESFPLENPATGEHFLTLRGASEDDVEKAYQAAKTAQPAWAALSPYDRVELVRAFSKLLTRDAAKLGALETVVAGKQIVVQLGDGPEKLINSLAGFALTTQGKTSTHTEDTLGMTTFHPYGVVACLMPFNAPIGKLFMSIIPALLAGNAVIIKPSERNALSPIAYGALFKEAGLPDGVVNILPGGSQVGALLAKHMGIRFITVTGSIGVGRAVAEAAAKSNLKRVVLELGGKSPALVFEDADIATAVGHLSMGIRLFAGQMCIANSRIYVQASIADKFKNAFTEHHFSHPMGNPWELTSALGMGPVVDKKAYNDIQAFIESARASGGTVLQGPNDRTKGYYVPATVLTDLPEDADVVKKEIFGNVVFISTFSSEADAIRLANDSEFGLYASVFTSNTDRAIRCSQALEAGTVVINGTAPLLSPDMPFGGFKQSGWGKELGPDAITTFMEEKTTFFKYASGAQK